jgi:hypothetical protein
MLFRRVTAPFLAFVILSCAAPVPHHSKPDLTEQRACTQRGGKYEQVGMFGTWACVVPYSDGGRVCTEDSQCVGGCIFEFGSGGPEPKKGDRVNGICQRTDAQFGCIAHVKDGYLIDDGICVD